MPDPTYEDYEDGLSDLPYSEDQPTYLDPDLVFDAPDEVLLGEALSITVRVNNYEGYALPVTRLSLTAPGNSWDDYENSDGVGWVTFQDASWPTPGPKPLIAVATLADGRTIKSRFVVNVLDPRPAVSLTLSRLRGYVNDAILADVSLDDIHEEHGAYIDAIEVQWGDGDESLRSSPGGSLSTGSYRFRHRYSRPGDYRVRARAITSRGWVSLRDARVAVDMRPQPPPERDAETDDMNLAIPAASTGGNDGLGVLGVVGILLAAVLGLGYALGRRGRDPRPS